jgi:aspartyl protease family protein
MSPHACRFAYCAAPRGGCCACGPAKPVPRPLVALNCVRFFASFLLAVLSAGAQAESVALAGMLGARALLVVNGTAPRTVAAGETHQGVKVISTSGDQAVVEQSGKRWTLRVGDAPVSVVSGSGTGGRGSRIVLTESSGGHFMTAGQINGRAVHFMVDTGATTIAMSTLDAERAGIRYKSGQTVQISTANGTVQGFRIKLDSVRVGDVEIYDVDAVVSPQPMPFLLLGNSFLTRFQMKRDNNLMTLDKRY